MAQRIYSKDSVVSMRCNIHFMPLFCGQVQSADVRRITCSATTAGVASGIRVLSLVVALVLVVILL